MHVPTFSLRLAGCSSSAAVAMVMTMASIANAADWSQWLGDQRDGVWREEGILEKFPEAGPKVLWKTAIGSGYAGPAVANGRVFVFDRVLADASEQPANPFERGEVAGKERVHCFDAVTGAQLWIHVYDCPYTVSYSAGPRTTPTVTADGFVFVLGAEGHLHCLKAEDGSVVWKKDFKADFTIKTPVWGFSAAPLVDGENIICLAGGDGTVAVAFDRKTGEEKWRALTAKEPGYSPPTMIEHAGHRQLIIWHPEAVNALNPATGEVLWSIEWKLRSGLSVATPQQLGNRLFFTCFYNGSLMLGLKDDGTKPDVLWQTERASEKRTVHLNSIIPTPYLTDGHLYGTCSYGEFRCLEIESGRRVWDSMQATTKEGEKERWANVFITPHSPTGRCFLFNESGELIITRLSPKGFEEIDRAKIIEPNGVDMRRRKIVWSHPAYAGKHCFVRNDNEIRCVSLAAEQ